MLLPVFTGAIGIGMLAEYGTTICMFVRAKKHGRQNQVEGFLKGQNVL
jgi:hypothetical protein